MNEKEVSFQEINLYSSFLQTNVTQFKQSLQSVYIFSNFLLRTFNLTTCSPVNGYFCILPQELIFYIFSFLNGTDLEKCCSINKEICRIASDDQLYRLLCIKLKYTINKPESKTWKWVYKCNKNIFAEKFKNGCGTYCWTEDKGKYIGEWQNDCRHGYGIQRWNDGSTYEGEWFEDKRHGTGTMTWADGQSYSGQWKYSRKEGKGVEVWADGRKYVGEYKNSNMHGTGIYSWPGGDIYEGEWKDDNMHGHGTYCWPNGSKYVGEWALDGHSGYGIYTCPIGETYEGEWRNNCRHGRGCEKWSNHTYDGGWNSNRKHGKGIYSWPDKDYYIGEWYMGRKWNKGLFVSKGRTLYQEWKDSEDSAFDELDKSVERGIDICSEEELKIFIGDDEMMNVDIELLLRKKRNRKEDDDEFPRQSKKKKVTDNHYHR